VVVRSSESTADTSLSPKLPAACRIAARLSPALRQHRRALLEAVAAAGGRNLRVFGSLARGQDGPSSDVDLLVDLPEGTGLFALLELEGKLERILKVKVDLAPESSLKPRVRAEALEDAIVL